MTWIVDDKHDNRAIYIPVPVDTWIFIPIITSPGMKINPGPTPENEDKNAPIQEKIIINIIFFQVNFKSP